MSEYIITTKQIEELNRAHGGMQIVTSWLSAYAVFDTSGFPPSIKSQHLAIALPNLVRCRDCLSWFRGECRKHVFTITVDGTEYDEGAFPMDANDFCSLGEMRDDAE